MRTLYGSYPSPYVRRIRMYAAGIDYEFKAINIYQDEGRAVLEKVSPIKKLPVWVEGEQTIFDSHVICDHIRKMKKEPAFTVEINNLVSAIDAVTDSFIILFMGESSGFDTTEDRLLFNLQYARLPDTLKWINEQAKKGAFDELHYGTMSLIAMYDWAIFRNLFDFEGYTDLTLAVKKHADVEIVKETFPVAQA